jgi:hypothetical protein
MQSLDEKVLLAAFHLMDDDEKRFTIDNALAITEGRSQRPRLTLVRGGAGGALTNSTFRSCGHGL